MVELLLSFDSAIGIEIKDVACAEDSRIALSGEFRFKLFPKGRFDGREVWVGGQVLDAVRIFGDIIQLFLRAFAETELKIMTQLGIGFERLDPRFGGRAVTV